jgi:hypothetical protein
MDFLGEQFERYLEEAHDEGALARKKERDKQAEKVAQDAQEARKEQNKYAKFGMAEPFFEMGAGIGELFGAMFSGSKGGKKEILKEAASVPKRDKNKLQKAAKDAGFEAILAYTIYKKSHRMLAW